MTPGEAIIAVQDALRARGLPARAGLRLADRTFIVAPGTGSEQAVPGIVAVLTAMGCGCTVDRDGIVMGRLEGRLLPAPPVFVTAKDGGRVAASAAVTVVAKRCNGPCGQVKPLEEFSWREKSRGWRSSYCKPCDVRRTAGYAARRAKPASTM